MNAGLPERKIGILVLVVGLAAFGVFTFFSSDARYVQSGIPLRESHFVDRNVSILYPMYLPSPYVPKPVPVPGLVIDHSVVGRALCESMPIFTPPTVSLLIHEARLWGSDTNFSSIFEKDISLRHGSSNELIDWLLNGVENKNNVFGMGSAPYLELSNFGVHVSLHGPDAGDDDRGESHFGQVAAALGLVGVRPERVIITDSGVESRFCDLLNDLVSNYSDDHELEFFAVAMVLYLDAPYEWVDRYGNRRSIDSLTRLMISKKGSSCYGTHVPFAVALALQRDRVEGNVLSKKTRALATYYMQKLSRELDLRSPDEERWGDLTKDEAGRIKFAEASDNQRMKQLTKLGHHLEWIALADPACRPSGETINKIVRDLDDIIVNLPPMELRKFKLQLPLSHATKALVALSGKPLSFHVSQILRR